MKQEKVELENKIDLKLAELRIKNNKLYFSSIVEFELKFDFIFWGIVREWAL